MVVWSVLTTCAMKLYVMSLKAATNSLVLTSCLWEMISVLFLLSLQPHYGSRLVWGEKHADVPLTGFAHLLKWYKAKCLYSSGLFSLYATIYYLSTSQRKCCFTFLHVFKSFSSHFNPQKMFPFYLWKRA